MSDNVELLSNTQFNAMIKAGPFQITDIVTGKSYKMCFGGARNDHYDITPQTEADTKIFESIAGGDLRKWRHARPSFVTVGNRRIAIGICMYMHHIRIGGGNPGPKYPSVSESGPPWKYGGHVCSYLPTSIGGAGDAPNPACSAAANARAMEVQKGAKGGQARAAAFEAYILGNIGKTLAGPVLMRGMMNNVDVKEAQQLLNNHGANPKLTVDGGFGQLTESAVITFQKSRGITADGMIGDETWKQLRAGGSATMTPAPSTATGNDKRIWDFLIGKGLNHFAAAGIMGNIFAESAFTPNNLQNSYEKNLGHTDASYTAAVDKGSYRYKECASARDSFARDGAGYGLVQWTYWSRKQGLYDFMKSWVSSIGDLTMQLNFMWQEMQGYPKMMAALKAAASVREASNAVLLDYERPASMNEKATQDIRAGYGQTQYSKFAGSGNQASVAFMPYSVRVTTDALNVREGPGTNFAKSGMLTDKGVYTILDEADGAGAAKWGKIKAGDGGAQSNWIALDYTKRV